jgi:hypothetical protein
VSQTRGRDTNSASVEIETCAVTARLMVQRSDLLKFDQARDKTISPPYFECSSLQLIPNSLSINNERESTL